MVKYNALPQQRGQAQDPSTSPCPDNGVQKAILAAVVFFLCIVVAFLCWENRVFPIGWNFNNNTLGTPGTNPWGLPRCQESTPCPQAWLFSGGGFFCKETRGCRPGVQGLFPACPSQCVIGEPPAPAHTTPQPTVGTNPLHGTDTRKPHQLTKPVHVDLRMVKGQKLLGCASPIGLFPGQPKYGCSGDFATAVTCDAARHPVKETDYVRAVHEGCETEEGRGTYGYAYDDGVGLKQCSPLTKYEWVLCPTGQETGVTWPAEESGGDSVKRFRVTNKCKEPIWISQAAPDGGLPGEPDIVRINAGYVYTYAVPRKGLASTRFLPKTGCDSSGNNCDIQSMPPCPAQGCDLPIDTKFEASWGCEFATGVPEHDKEHCTLTGQGNPSTYQDWWDGSAVDGWTLPFSILVDDGGHGLAPGIEGSPAICGAVVCANLVASKLCPTREYLTPEV